MIQLIRMNVAEKETNPLPELNNKETLALLDSLITNLPYISNTVGMGRRGFPDIEGKGPEFKSNIKKTNC